MSTYQKEHMEMEYARHFLRALKLLERSPAWATKILTH